MQACFECGDPGDHEHHVIPQVRGGTKTVCLCAQHHAMVHGFRSMACSELVKAGIARARAEGRKMGHPRLHDYDEIYRRWKLGDSKRKISEDLKVPYESVRNILRTMRNKV